MLQKQISVLIKQFQKLRWWQVVIIALIVTAIGGLSSMQSDTVDRKLYTEQLLQAPWSPPGWLFGPAWTFINIFLLIALQKILNANISNRKQVLILQVCIWCIFFTFGYVYFNRRSSVLAAIWTIVDAIFAISSYLMLIKNEKKIAYHYLPLIIWTVFASTVAGYQALKNPDPVFNTEAILD